MHCAPLENGGGSLRGEGTLFDWYAALFPAAADISGRKQGEGGLLHRLDFETQGLTLFAKNQLFADELLAQQRSGTFIKEYSAICVESARMDSTFPPLTAGLPPRNSNGALSSGFVIESFFRPYGPGRKQVRPVTEAQAGGKTARYEIARDRLPCGSSGCYRTEIVNLSKIDDTHYAFTARLARGFRHHIRCHLAWIGFPVANDPLYGAPLCALCGDGGIKGFLALRANALAFTDPRNGKAKECRIEPFLS
jgi:23S rRNA pseudouridine1911/1915/1917 synthase